LEAIMTKALTAKELAEIVGCLLIKPSILGELEDRDRHSEFMQEIGNVVTAFCGGDICGLDDGDDSDEDEYRDPLLIVQPNDSLPSLNQNVWSLFDTESWDLDSDSDTKPYSEDEILAKRNEIRALLSV
jgi:hypothetical protein